MSIKMIIEDGLLRPAVFCDHCVDEITDHKDGCLAFESVDKNPPEPFTGEIFYLHRDCYYSFLEGMGKFEKRRWVIDDLDDFIVHLMANLEVDFIEAVNKAKKANR